MNRDDDPKLWDLLGQAQKAAPSAFFSRNVIRAVRQHSPEKTGLAYWLRWRRVVPAVSIIGAMLLTFAAVQTFHKHPAPPPDDPILLANGPDPDLATDLDLLDGADDDDDSAVL